MRRLFRLVAVLVLLGSSSLFGTGQASADPLKLADCTTSSGVILAVDFGHWGGPVMRSCFSTPTTGFYLLNHGGWSTAGTVHDGPAFICRIGYSGYQGGNLFPTTAEENCHETPPATKYWSYWHANADASTWSYSQLGAQSYSPKPGSVDAWVYGGTASPSFSPDSVRAHNASPPAGAPISSPSTPPAPPTTTPTGGSGRPSSGGSTAATGGRTSAEGATTGLGNGPTAANAPISAASSSEAAAARSASRASASKSAARTSSSAPVKSATAPGRAGQSPSNSPKIVDAEPAADIKHSSGSYVPELVAGVILVVLGGFTGLRHWRRKQVSRQS